MKKFIIIFIVLLLTVLARAQSETDTTYTSKYTGSAIDSLLDLAATVDDSVAALRAALGSVPTDTSHYSIFDYIIQPANANITLDNTNKKIIFDSDSARFNGDLDVDGNIILAGNNDFYINSGVVGGYDYVNFGNFFAGERGVQLITGNGLNKFQVYQDEIVLRDSNSAGFSFTGGVESWVLTLGESYGGGLYNGIVVYGQVDKTILYSDSVGIRGDLDVDGSLILQSGTLTQTELSYLDGATSNLQTQITALATAGISDGDYGDVTVSGGIWSVENDSHNHVISNVDGLQDELDAKEDDLINSAGLRAALNDESGTGNFLTTNGDGSGLSGVLTGNETITLTGDASGSGTTSIAVTVADYSHAHVIGNVNALQDSLNDKLNLDDSTLYATQYDLSQVDATLTGDTLNYSGDEVDSLLALAGSAMQNSNAYYDTLSFNWGVMDTVIAGELCGWKIPNNITITEIAAYTDANTTTFNLEERGEATPNTSGTDVMAADLVADNDQQEQTSFSNADIDRNAWLVPSISATGDVSIFSITVRYIKR